MPDVVSRDGTRIHYEARGQGMPVVLLHPNNATCESWIELGWFDTLDSLRFRAVSLDARGFGQSDPVTKPESLSPGTSTSDITAVLDALEIQAAHLCGFSLGAAVAVRFAVDEPARVTSLVLGGLASGPLAQVGLYLGTSPEQARRRALGQLDQVLRTASETAAAYFRAVRTAISGAELSPLAGANLRSPILGVAGESDPYDGLSLYEDLRSDGAAIRIEAIPDVGHGSCFVHPRFREAAAEFWASKPAV